MKKPVTKKKPVLTNGAGYFDFYTVDTTTFVVAFFVPGESKFDREVCVVNAFGEWNSRKPSSRIGTDGLPCRSPKQAETDACEIASALNTGLCVSGLVKWE